MQGIAQDRSVSSTNKLPGKEKRGEKNKKEAYEDSYVSQLYKLVES